MLGEIITNTGKACAEVLRWKQVLIGKRLIRKERIWCLVGYWIPGSPRHYLKVKMAGLRAVRQVPNLPQM